MLSGTYVIFKFIFFRSWLYIHIHHIPAQLLYPVLVSSKVAFFHALRFVIGFLSLISDICLYESVSQRFGNRIGLFFIVFSMFSVGMFYARFFLL